MMVVSPATIVTAPAAEPIVSFERLKKMPQKMVNAVSFKLT